jgi:hypothetical protein
MSIDAPERDPAKDEYIRRTVDRHNRGGTVSWSYIVAGGMLIIAFAAVSLKQDETMQTASVLTAGQELSHEEYADEINLVRSRVGWTYDSGTWQAIRSPVGLGTVVIMSDDFLWYVEEDGTIYVINGIAKTVTPQFEYAHDITADDVFAVLRR